jgi:hypothetical protein
MVLSRRCPGGGTGTTGWGVRWVRAQAVLRQLSEQNRCRPTGRNALQQTGQAGLVIVVLSSPDGGSARMTDGVAEVVGSGLVGPEPVAVALEVQDDAAVEEPVEHGGGDHLIAEH